MKKIIILGATSGIGRAAALAFLRAGWKVGVAGRREDKLRELQLEFPAQIAYEVIDVLAVDAVDGLHRLIDKMDGIDVYLHSTGIGSQNTALNAEIELDIVQTNAVGFVRMMTAAFHYFTEKGGGQIATISSIAGTKGLGAAPAYSATKRFQRHYIDSLAQLANMEHRNIRFTDIRPGFVATALLKDQKYPLMMTAEHLGKAVYKAIIKRKRVSTEDWRYRLLVAFWQLIPRAIWERLRVK